MNLTPYLEAVRHGATSAAALADDATQQVATRLGAAIESSTRLALIDALSDAAGDISAELAPGSVELRMTAGDPVFVVTAPAAASEPTLLLPPSEESPLGAEPEADDEPLARVSLRLPQSVKTKVEEMADRDGISANAWLLRAVVDALADRPQRGWAGLRPDSGWPGGPPPIPTPPHPGGAHPVVTSTLGPDGPFGPSGMFGPQGVFGPQGFFGQGGGPGGGRRRRDDRPSRGDGRRSGSVQGWVR